MRLSFGYKRNITAHKSVCSFSSFKISFSISFGSVVGEYRSTWKDNQCSGQFEKSSRIEQKKKEAANEKELGATHISSFALSQEY